MENSFSCIIIDDEPKAIELLRGSLSSLYSNINIVGTYTSWRIALEALRECNFDIVFIDISMPEKNGIDLLNLVPNLSCEIIFITAYADYALEAFSYPAAGYILKPVKDGNLTKALDKVFQRLHYKKMVNQEQACVGQKRNTKIGIPHYKGIEYVNIDDIIYFEAVKRYAKVVTSRSEILSSYSIGKFRHITESNLFYQVHRSYIINTVHMLRYENTGVIIMANNKAIPISKNVKQHFLNLFDAVNRVEE
ncbi:MAG TPA: LytTR family DNA-binding domain-containing protein [Flavipsychrobacter sp.]|nr:LytTR family DNA-binding domain-containing protein [Flavipsychrobacter sp.]